MQIGAMQLLSMWITQLEVQNQSAHTLDAYFRDVTAFIEFCYSQQLQLNQVEASDLRQYLAYKVEQQQLSSTSLQRHLSSIRQFMKWAEQGKYLSMSPGDDFKLKRQSRPLPGLIDIETINQILDQAAPATPLEQQLWTRDRAMLEFLYSSGLRLAELQSLNFNDINLGRMLVRVTGKGNKTRVVPFGQKAKDALLLWMQSYVLWSDQLTPEAAVFISQKGQRLSPRQIENRVKHQALRAGVGVDLHPHLLRHCFASHLLTI